jgi:hypothetical protein
MFLKDAYQVFLETVRNGIVVRLLLVEVCVDG